MNYLTIHELLKLIPGSEPLERILSDHRDRVFKAPGSSHNHQAWEGGYVDHVQETMNTARWLYDSCPRKLPFELADALVVLFLHDIEKPWKDGMQFKTKEARRIFRGALIAEYGIRLWPEQENALRYVEGVPDSEYTPGERTMGELAAFCHMCDIASARIWHDKGREGRW